MKLVGIVRSGIGDLGQWIAKLADRYENKTGMRLFPGTLNIHLKEEYKVPGFMHPIGSQRVWWAR